MYFALQEKETKRGKEVKRKWERGRGTKRRVREKMRKEAGHSIRSIHPQTNSHRTRKYSRPDTPTKDTETGTHTYKDSLSPTLSFAFTSFPLPFSTGFLYSRSKETRISLPLMYLSKARSGDSIWIHKLMWHKERPRESEWDDTKREKANALLVI